MCFSKGRSIVFPDEIAYAMMRVNSFVDKSNSDVVQVIIGLNDLMYVTFTDPSATMCNIPWLKFFEKTGISPEDIWIDSLVFTFLTSLTSISMVYFSNDFLFHLGAESKVFSKCSSLSYKWKFVGYTLVVRI